jgi:hypothetical protein
VLSEDSPRYVMVVLIVRFTCDQEPQVKATPATPRSIRRGRHAHTSSISKRTAIERQRRSMRQRQHAAGSFGSPPRSTSPGHTSFPLPQDFDAEMDDEDGDMDQVCIYALLAKLYFI